MQVPDEAGVLIPYLSEVVTLQSKVEETRGLKEGVVYAQQSMAQTMPRQPNVKAPIKWKVVIVVFLLAMPTLSELEHHGIPAGLLFELGVIAYVIAMVVLARRAREQVQVEHALAMADYNNRLAFVRDYSADVQTLADDCADTLQRLYDAGPLPPKYRNLAACATFLEWLRYGQTYHLSRQGSDEGAYNMYEEKLRHGEILGELSAIHADVKSIGATQAELLGAVQRIQYHVWEMREELHQLSVSAGAVADDRGTLVGNIPHFSLYYDETLGYTLDVRKRYGI